MQSECDLVSLDKRSHGSLSTMLTRVTTRLWFRISTFCPHSARVYVLCGSENKQLLFLYTGTDRPNITEANDKCLCNCIVGFA
jgi:hypothetical protein